MLVLTRKLNESIYIGDNIKITIVNDGSRGGGIRIGIDAPREIAVHREEVWDAIQRVKDREKT